MKIFSFKPMEQSFYERDTRIVAIELLGKYLVRKIAGKILIGKIVETEAYLGEIDPACHFCDKVTDRSSAFFQPGGYSYVYLIYGKYYCLNVITDSPETKGAVLLRALEPITEISLMEQTRKVSNKHELTNGPGKLTQAFQITMDNNKQSLLLGPLTICSAIDEIDCSTIGVSPRIGISKAIEWQLRYFLVNNPFVSGKKSMPYTLVRRNVDLPNISLYTHNLKF